MSNLRVFWMYLETSYYRYFVRERQCTATPQCVFLIHLLLGRAPRGPRTRAPPSPLRRSLFSPPLPLWAAYWCADLYSHTPWPHSYQSHGNCFLPPWCICPECWPGPAGFGVATAASDGSPSSPCAAGPQLYSARWSCSPHLSITTTGISIAKTMARFIALLAAWIIRILYAWQDAKLQSVAKVFFLYSFLTNFIRLKVSRIFYTKLD